jgi:hypothetical protein
MSNNALRQFVQSDQSLKQTFDDSVAYFDRGNWDALRNLLHPNVVVAGVDDPSQNVSVGQDEAIEALQATQGNFKTLTCFAIPSGSHGVVFGIANWTDSDDKRGHSDGPIFYFFLFANVAAEGQPVQWKIVRIWGSHPFGDHD